MEESKDEFVLTINIVKDCITFTDKIGEILRNLCDCWYEIALKQGKTDEEACLFALNELGNKLNEMTKQKENV